MRNEAAGKVGAARNFKRFWRMLKEKVIQLMVDLGRGKGEERVNANNWVRLGQGIGEDLKRRIGCN